MERQFVGVIEWPAHLGCPPTVIVGASTLEELDAKLIAYLEMAIATDGPIEETEHEAFVLFVRANPFPPKDATDTDRLLWLIALKAAKTDHLIHVMVANGAGVADGDSYAGRYFE